MRETLARWIIYKRGIFLAIMAVITAFFAWGAKDVKVATVFTELLPSNHRFVKTFLDHPNFGNPLTIQIMVRRTDGSIYNPETLGKVWDLTRDIDLAPAIDHDQILSISTEKARYAEATPFGIESKPLMGDHAPANAAEVKEFQERLAKAPGISRFLISPDGTATLIRATFIERLLDYGKTFEFTQHLVEQARCTVKVNKDGSCPAGKLDTHHEVHAAGQPMLTGWVYRYESEMMYIFGITIGLMLLLLVLYTRNLAGVVTPIVVSVVCAIWGFGLAGWLGHNVEPLILIVPLLLVARSISHAVQQTERYYELLFELGDPSTGKLADKRFAAFHALRVMVAPGVVGIITDILGLYLIAIAPIPMLQKFAIFCGWWAVALIPGDAFLTPVVLSYLPVPHNVESIVSPTKRTPLHRSIFWLLGRAAACAHGSAAKYTTAVSVLVILASIFVVVTRLELGNAASGSSLLWPDSEYNSAVMNLNKYFPGLNTLEVVFEGKHPQAMRSADAEIAMQRIQRRIESDPNPPSATLSFADYPPEANRLFSGGNPKWLPLDSTDRAVNAAVGALLIGNNPKNFSNVADFTLSNGTVSLWYKDKAQGTIERALKQADDAIKMVGADHKDFRIRMASGTIALQKSVNDTVHVYHWLILGLLVTTIFITVSLAYRSLVGGFILLLSVNVANLLLLVAMVILGIGLDVNTMPVAAIGIGVGIDYGIYLLSRICEEYQTHHDYGAAIDAAVTTTGKAIFFTATIVVVGILPWYFMSNLKFLADMGLLLVLIMLINAALALIFVPLLVYLIKPAFVRREDQLLGEKLEVGVAHSAAAGE